MAFVTGDLQLINVGSERTASGTCSGVAFCLEVIWYKLPSRNALWQKTL